MKKTKVYLGLPSTGQIIDSQAYLLRDISELYKDHIELVYPSQCVRRVFHDYARNAIVDDFLATDCDVLWFLDSDITPSLHVLDLVALHKDKWLVAGATYPVFMKTPHTEDVSVVFTVYKKNVETGNFGLRDTPKSGQEFVDGLATGCLFIKREVFAKLAKPYFEFKFDPESREMAEGEDLGFCRKLSTLGIQFFTDFELVCKHQKNVDLLDVNNYAIAYSNGQISQYDAMIRNEIKIAINEAYEKGIQEGARLLIEKIKEQEQPKSKLITSMNDTSRAALASIYGTSALKLSPQGLILPK